MFWIASFQGSVVPHVLSKIDYQRLTDRLGYEFADKNLLSLALTHRSAAAQNNERLEFLGDSILNFTIGEYLFKHFVQAKEGQLSRLRAQLVKGETLAEIARELQLGSVLTLGDGEMKSGGSRRDSILADSVEAIIGAIYLDAGMGVCQESIIRWYLSRLENLTLDVNVKDAKTRLQELLQAQKKPLPEYKVVDTSGEAHSQIFKVECLVSGLAKPVYAEATNRRAAEKLAATEALKAMQSKTPVKTKNKGR